MRTNTISEREREILIEAAAGLTDKEIGAKLDISPRTIGTYWERLRQKTGATSRTQMVMSVLGKELEAVAREAREARAELDFLLEQAEDYALFCISPDCELLDWNPGVLRVLGFKEEEFVGKPYSITFTPGDAANKEPEYELQRAREHGRFVEYRYHAKSDGTHIWVAGTIVAIKDEAGKIVKFSKIMRDDSVRKSLEEEIQRLQAQPQQLRG